MSSLQVVKSKDIAEVRACCRRESLLIAAGWNFGHMSAEGNPDLLQPDAMARSTMSCLLPREQRLAVRLGLQPVSVMRDGVCLFHSLSCLLVGDEHLSTTLKVDTAIELYNNNGFVHKQFI